MPRHSYCTNMNEVEFELDVQLQAVLVREDYGFFSYAGYIKGVKEYIEDTASTYSTLELEITQIGSNEFGVIVKNIYRAKKAC
jgi:hypothetical protein